MSFTVVHVASGREWRGGQRQVWLLARGLGKLGVDQVVVTGEATELARRLQSAGVPIRPAAWRAGLDPRVLWAILLELRHRPAVLHAHDAHAVTLAGVAAALTGTPLVVTRRVTFPLRRLGFWKRAKRAIAISQAVLESMVTAGLKTEQIVVVPDSVDLQEVPASRNVDIRQLLGLPLKGQVAVALGSLTPEKDHSTLVSAAGLLVQDLPDLHWVIIGEGPLRPQLERQIRESGLQDRVHLAGQLADPHLALAGADVFVLSSTAEGLGSSILAAMAVDLPVVASRVGGVPDLLGSGAGIMVSPRVPEELAAAVHRVLTQPELRRDLTRLARTKLGDHSVNTVAARVLGVYRSCVHSLDGS